MRRTEVIVASDGTNAPRSNEITLRRVRFWLVLPAKRYWPAPFAIEPSEDW